MHVAIDMTALVAQGTGADVYISQIVSHLTRVDSHNRYTLFVNYEDRNRFHRPLPKNFAVCPLSLRPRAARFAFQQILLPVVARVRGIDVVHSPSFLVPFLCRRARQFLVVHDMTFFQMPEMHSSLRSSPAFLWAVRRSIAKADLICVPSQATRDALLAEMPHVPTGRIRLVPYGVDERFRPGSFQEARDAWMRLGLDRPYILFVGTLEPRKNLRLLVESYRQLVAQGIAEHLVLAGKPGWGIEDLERDLQAPELQGRVHRLGYVPDRDLDSIYHGAAVFVYPSRCEGFGFPPLEAMACGIPVVATDNSSLSENLAGAAEMVPDADPAALGAAILGLLASPERRARTRELGLARAASFHWDRSALLTVECYRELAGKSPASAAAAG